MNRRDSHRLQPGVEILRLSDRQGLRQLVGGLQLLHNIKPSHQFTLDKDLGKRGPLGELLHACHNQ